MSSTTQDRKAPALAQRVRQVVADAAYDHKLEAAGIAVAPVDQLFQVYRSEAVPASSVQQAEAQAIAAAVDYLGSQKGAAAGSVVLSDSLDVIRAVLGEIPAELAKVDPATVALIRDGLERRGFELRKAERQQVRAAHRGARAVLQAYRAGVTLAGSGPATLPATTIVAGLIARIKATVPVGIERGDLAFEIARHLENYGTDSPDAMPTAEQWSEVAA